MVVYSLGMTLYWCVDYHLPQNQVHFPPPLISRSQSFWSILSALPMSHRFFCAGFLPAGPDECRAGRSAAQHVRGHGGEADRPADGAGDLRAPPQGLHATSCRSAHQAAGGRRLQKLCEWLDEWMLLVGFQLLRGEWPFFNVLFCSCWLQQLCAWFLDLESNVFAGWSCVHGWKWIPANRPQSIDQGQIAQ